MNLMSKTFNLNSKEKRNYGLYLWQPIADPFLGFLKKVFWKERTPHLKEGLFAEAWTLRHAIELNTGGINGPAQIATLCQEEGKYKAHLIEPEHLAEHEELVEAAGKYLSLYRDIMN